MFCAGRSPAALPCVAAVKVPRRPPRGTGTTRGTTLGGVPALRLSPGLAAWAELAAELVNTRPRETNPPEKLAAMDDLAALLERAPEPAPPAGESDLPAMRALRDALTGAFEAPTLDAL